MKRFHFTSAQLDELKKLYPRVQNKDLAKKYGCTIRKINEAGPALGVKKDRAFISEVARKNLEDNPNHPIRKFFKQKGCIPMNKGLRQVDYMTPEKIALTRATQFKKGILPWNTVSVGSERTREGYVEVKIKEPNEWKAKHRIVWETIHGPIPAGMNVQFRDHNTLNIDPENLYIVSRKDQMMENSFLNNYSPEIQALIWVKGALTRQINKQTKILQQR